MITPDVIAGVAIGGAVGSVWSSFVLGRLLHKRHQQVLKLLELNNEARQQFKVLAHNWLMLAQRVTPGDARVEQVGRLLAEMETRDVMARAAQRVQ